MAAVILLLTGACGDGADTPNTVEATEEIPREGPAATWTTEVLGSAPNPDVGLLTATDDRGSALVAVDEDGSIHGWFSTDGGPFVAGPPTETDTPFLSLMSTTRTSDGWYAVGNSYSEEETPPVAFRSDDGATWEEAAAQGFEADSDLRDVVGLADGTLVIVGARRAADDAEPSQPLAWRSTDGGTTWTQVEVPGGDGYVPSVVQVGDGLLAAGSDGDSRPAFWRSTDTGTSWTSYEPEGLDRAASIGPLAVSGDLVVTTVALAEDEDGGPSIPAWSDDRGATWHVAELPDVGADSYSATLHQSGGRFFLFTDPFDELSGDLGRCYTDLEWCRQARPPALLTSTDGAAWTVVDTSGLALEEYEDLDSVTGTGDVVTLVSVGEDGVRTHTTAVLDLTSTQAPPQPAEVDLLAYDDRLEVGERQPFPISTHCGIDWLGGFNATNWRIDLPSGSGSATEPDDDWPSIDQFVIGYVTLVSEDRIEYSVGDGEVVAEYVSTSEEPIPCG